MKADVIWKADIKIICVALQLVLTFYQINVKKLQFIHMLTATDDRSSQIKNSKNITIMLHIVICQCAAV